LDIEHGSFPSAHSTENIEEPKISSHNDQEPMKHQSPNSNGPTFGALSNAKMAQSCEALPQTAVLLLGFEYWISLGHWELVIGH
jgi:hypothetical protein